MLRHSFDTIFVTLTMVVTDHQSTSVQKYRKVLPATQSYKKEKIAGVVNSANEDIAKADCYVGFTILDII